jgi:hypothetical protein
MRVRDRRMLITSLKLLVNRMMIKKMEMIKWNLLK